MLKYIWIEDYKNIKNTGLNFSINKRFTFKLCKEKDSKEKQNLEGILSMDQNSLLNIFPSQISSISVLVGENGAGKSSVLEYVFSSLFKQYNGFKGILIIDNYIIISDNIKVTLSGLDDYEVLSSKEKLQNFIKGKVVESQSIMDSVVTDTLVFSYSPFFNFDRISHIEGYSGENERFENGKLFDISSVGQLVSDYNSNFQFFNKDALSTINPLVNHRSLESLRHLEYLINHKKSVLFTSNIEKVQFTFNDYYINYWEKIVEMFSNNNKASGDFISQFRSNLEGTFEDNYYKAIFFFLLNVFKDIKEREKSRYNPFLDTCECCNKILKLNSVKNYKSAVSVLLKRNAFNGVRISVFADILKLIKKSNSQDDCGFFVNHNSFNFIRDVFSFIYKNKCLNIKGVSYLLNIFNIDFIGLSSGEKSLLSLFSRLEYTNNNLKMFKSNIKWKKIVLLLDEPEIGLHPQWQKEYISKLLEYIKTTLRNYKEVQIILTTHSPILLSDIPSQHITYLKKNKDGMCEIVEKKSESFGANIYDLYNSSFFLRDGFIGAFSQKYINQLIKNIDKLKPSTPLEKIKELQMGINIIGEELIRSSLENFLFEKVKRPQNDTDVLKERIKELESEVKKYEKNQDR